MGPAVPWYWSAVVYTKIAGSVLKNGAVSRILGRPRSQPKLGHLDVKSACHSPASQNNSGDYVSA